MSAPLISDAELAALRGFAVSGMQTTVAIYHGVKTVTDDGQTWGYPATPDLTVLGWNYEITSAGTTLDSISGVTALSELHRLMLPVGTDCRSGDKIVIGGSSYVVQHTNDDDSYPMSLQVNMRDLVP